MKRLALVFLTGTIISVLLYMKLETGLILSIAVSLGTTAYHFIMRLLVGWSVNAVMHNRANCDARWFRPLQFEEKLYRKLRVAAWKKYLPSYQPELFSMNGKSLNEIAQAMCQAEIVHEIIIPLSFVPLFMIPRFDSAAVFIITSILAACFDLLFVIIQRFNRPRILKISRRFG